MVKVELYINDTLSSVGAIFADDLKVSCERTDGEMYRRVKLTETFTFVGDDFDLLYNSNFEDSFEIHLKDDNYLIAKGKFEKTDCEFDVDNKICKVKVSSTDNYEKILSAINDEHDLIKLAPERRSIGLQKRAILQLYMYRDTKVTNVIGNMSYEVDLNSDIDVNNLTHRELISTYNFVELGDGEKVITISGSGMGLDGEYVGAAAIGNTRFVRRDGLYYLDEYHETIWDSSGEGGWVDWYSLAFKNSSGEYVTVRQPGGEEGYRDCVVQAMPTSNGYPLPASDFGWREFEIDTGNWVWQRHFGGSTTTKHEVYARILLDTANPNPAVGVVKKLSSTDMCANNLNYNYCMQASGIVGLRDRIVESAEVQDAPTPWGVNGEGKYYVRPRPAEIGDNVLPVGWNRWIPMSFWFNSSPSLSQILDQWNVAWNLKDAYPLWSVLKVLLAKADPSISFENSSEYSQFLFGDVGSAIYGHTRQNYYLTPATNVKKTYYNQAARKAKITLKQVLDMLRKTFQLYWFIDEQKRFRIEHITWFKNGGTYTQSNALVDLTQIYSLINKKTWGYGQNTISYKKSDLYKRYEFAWGDKCTEAFDGFPIDIKNKYVGNGKTLKSDIAGVITDIDMLMSAPDRVSDDSLVLIGTTLSSDTCPIASVGNYGMDFIAPIYVMQNGWLSFYNLELVYWAYNFGGDKATTSQYETTTGGDGNVTVRGTQRVKMQSVSFPMDKTLFAKEGLVHTQMGDGEWVTETYHPNSGKVEMELIMPIKGIEYLSINPQSIETDYQGGIINIEVNSSSDDWHIQGTSDWCVIEKKSSTSAIVRIQQNLSSVSRSSGFDFVVGNLVVTLTVQQSTEQWHFSISPAQMTFKDTGETMILTIDTSDAWEIKQLPEWISVDKTIGVGYAQVQVTAQKNVGNSRFDTFSVTTKNSGTKNVLCNQLASGVFVVDVDREKCINCGVCYDFGSCPVGVFKIGDDDVPYIEDGCIACAECIDKIPCPTEVFVWKKI